MALPQWELEQQLSALLPLGEGELNQIISYVDTLSTPEANEYLHDLLGNSPEALRFVSAFNETRGERNVGARNNAVDGKGNHFAPPDGPPAKADVSSGDVKSAPVNDGKDRAQNASNQVSSPTMHAPPPMPPPTSSRAAARHHTNQVIEAGKIRAQDEVRSCHVSASVVISQLTTSQQEMQQMLLNLQYQYGIYNSDIEPEHETDYYCSCPIHQYQWRKWRRYGVQESWSRAVMYPGKSPLLAHPYCV